MNDKHTRCRVARRVKSLLRGALRALGFEFVRRRPGLDWTKLLAELDDHRAFRTAAEAEIRALKDQGELDRDQLRVQSAYVSSLKVLVTAQEREPTRDAARIEARTGILPPRDGTAAAPAPGSEYPSCPWIEGGVSFIPGRLRVCPNSHAGGGTPGLVAFSEGPLPVSEIVAQRDIIRRANRLDCFVPCAKCAFRVTRSWKSREHLFDLVCIAHATACNLACAYCHSIPEARYLQNPNSVPRLYPTFARLIADGLLAPKARIQWGGGEPTILREFDALFGLLSRHGADSEVYSSGVRIPEVLIDALIENRAGVMVSLDAGTADTYARIKGRAAFDRVVANVARYARANPGRTLLKMILSSQNLDEVCGFLDVAEKAGVRIVCFDTMMFRDRVDESVIAAAARFQLEAAKRGLECRGGEVGLIYNLDDHVAERIESMRSTLAA